MNWNADSIRELRLRLGFSASDLARRLHCEISDVRSWEEGQGAPQGFQLQQLEFLCRQAESYSEDLTAFAWADQVLETDELGQIDLDEVKTRFSGNN